MGILKPKDSSKLQKLLLKAIGNKKLFLALIAIVFFIVNFIIISNSIVPEKYNLELGDIATAEIMAPKDIINKIATDRLKEEARSSIQPRYKPDYSVSRDAENIIKSFFIQLDSVRRDETLEKDQKIAIAETNFPIKLSNAEFSKLLDLKDQEILAIESNSIYIINTVMSARGLLQEDVEKEKANIVSYFNSLKDLSVDGKHIASLISTSVVRPTLILDDETTEEKIEEVLSKVEPILVKKGSTIIKKGEEATEEHLYLLKNLGILETDVKIDFALYAGIALLIIISEAMVGLYIYFIDKKLAKEPRLLLMASMIIVILLMIGKTFAGINIFVIPASAAAMLISLLIGPKIAIVLNLVLSLFMSVVVGHDITILSISIISGTLASFCAINSHQRSSLFVSGLAIGLANGLAIVAFGFINSNNQLSVLVDCLYGLLNGLFVAVIAVGTLPLWEITFKVLTPLKLIELSNPNQPLLKKLLFETPGTYHHSIIVGNLSEAAADKIGANGLLARVGAYYHDIGKLKRPYFFKENQLTSENPHDKITPSLSTLIITSHIKDGMEIAKKYKLPIEIIDFIQQHHGNSLVKFFYHKALNGENGENIKEDSFRYEGPNPSSKETAIVMMADSVEAAVRSMSDTTKVKMEALVKKIIKEKLEDGQLDNSDLNLRDLNIISETFVSVLLGIFHERVEYPEIDSKNTKGGLLKHEGATG